MQIYTLLIDIHAKNTKKSHNRALIVFFFEKTLVETKKTLNFALAKEKSAYSNRRGG